MGIFGAVLGGVASALIGARGASSAGKATERAANEQTEFQREMYDETVARMRPYSRAGRNALDAYMYELGLGEQPEGYEGMALSPAAKFQLHRGNQGIEASAAARGGLYSGATMGALEHLRSGIATQDRDNQLNRMAGVVSSGQNAAGNLAAAGQNYAATGSNAIADIGNARAAGAIGTSNALLGGLGQGFQIYELMRRNQPQTPVTPAPQPANLGAFGPMARPW
jgi:hypothetical protein